MKQQPIYRTLSLALACWLCAGSLLHAREYADLYARHGKQRHGETHARLTADLLILGRTNSAPSITILTSEPDGGPITPLLNTTDLELNAYVSGRYDLILTDDSDYELQFTLTGFPSGQQAEASRTDPDVTARLFGFRSADDPDRETDNVKYVSKFGSGEINLRHRLGSRATWFSGFRYIALQEDLDFIDESNEGLFADTDNALYGYQIGVESTVWTNGKARVDLIGRGGIFYSHIEVGLRGEDADDESLIFKRQTDKAAFASDLQATLFVPLGPGTLRLGYQLFYVNKAAFVPNQLDSVNFANETGSIELSSPIYHGGFLGLEVPF